MRLCSKCKINPQPENHSYCRTCNNRYSKEYRASHPNFMRNAALKRRYGITQDDFDAMLAEQGNLCLICASKSELVVDHCHQTGKVRGLLCVLCNGLLGQARDDVKILGKAIRYLRKH